MHLRVTPFQMLRENGFQALYEGPVITMTTPAHEFLTLSHILQAFLARLFEVLKLPRNSVRFGGIGQNFIRISKLYVTQETC